VNFKFALQRLLRLTGFELIHLETARRQTLSPQLSEIFARYDVSCVLDVGANTGEYRDYLREKVGYKKTIISFEPVRSVFDRLEERSKRDPNWKVFNFALGPANTTQEINVMKLSMFSSFQKPDTLIEPTFRELNVIDHTETVEMRTLDTVMEELGAECPAGKTYLKMDTQGFDMEVIRGAEKCLGRIIALQTEATVRALYKDVPNFVKSYEILAAKGFDTTGMFPLSWDRSQRVIEFDFVFVNSALI
jgi:FkbM family methyltransferase